MSTTRRPPGPAASAAKAPPRADGAHAPGSLDPERAYARLERATAGLQAPFALIDLDALRANAAELERQAAGLPIRLASKSLRCRELQRRVLARPGFHGTLAFTLPEALWLADQGFDDIVVAYPSADAHALRAVADGPHVERVAVMVDDAEQLPAIECALAGARAAIRVCIDVDAGWRALRGRVRIGVKRSPTHTPTQAAALARAIAARDGVRLVGVMMYEAQIAGLGDDPPGRPARALAIRAVQALSARELRTRRAAVVAAVQGALADAGRPPLQLVNGGGTGSVARSAREGSLSEVTAGSGLYAPTLFDSYRSLRLHPAALFALPVVRRPCAGVATVLGGGYLASGAADSARLPRVHLPSGLRLDREEGAGEVQTPLLGARADALALGDRVYMRHAKAGELCERFASVHVLEGERVVEELATYRGEGQCFL